MRRRRSCSASILPFLRFVFLVTFSFLGSQFLLCHAHSSNRLPLVAGIFGLGGGKNEESENKPLTQQPLTPGSQQQQQPQQQRPPGQDNASRAPPFLQGNSFGRSASASIPPELRNRHPPYPPQQRPPPPPPPRTAHPNDSKENEEDLEKDQQAEAVEDESNETLETLEETSNSQFIRPPPPPQMQQQYQQWNADPYQSLPPPPQQQGWMGPPPPSVYNGWQQPQYYGMEESSGNPMFLREELDLSLAREADLLAQLDNMTAAVVVMEQREELHMRQLDVLTERVMDVEAQAAEDRNLLAEYEANCTALGMTVATLQQDIENWKKRCSEFADRHDEDKEKLAELHKLIREKSMEAEDLAIAIENLRLAEKMREATGSRSTSNGGFFSWIFSFFSSSENEFEEMTREEVYEMAKSTLLRALQAERGNVHELEAAVASLQQNNSAISEMVESRDIIIDELNNRIAVFEEDKVVLKAALRQLQKEIKEEAPKAQKLMDNLAKAEQQIKKLKSEMNGIIQTHQEEVLALQKTISMKQKAISETESNLTAIGTYVDKLEERLTSFAVTRRDMEERERICREIEEKALVTENERNSLQVKVEEYAKEQEEVKKLLEELASERAILQKDNRKLLTEREFRIAEQEQLQGKCATLENEMKELSDKLYEWKSKCEILEPELNMVKACNEELKLRVDEISDLEKEIEISKSKCAEVEQDYERAQAELQSLRDENEKLEALANRTKAELEAQTKSQEEQRSPVKEIQTPLSGSNKTRNVPFRAIRKQLSKATGIHGLITPSSKTHPKPPPKLQLRETLSQQKKGFALSALPQLAKGSGPIHKGQIPAPPPLPAGPLPKDTSS